MNAPAGKAALPPVLQQVVKSQTCAGCGLCAGLDPAIQMARDDQGWWRPRAVGTARPATNTLLAGTCPGAIVSSWDRPEQRAIHPLWGPHIRVMTGFSTDPELRHTASSGGALSAIALHLLQSGAVDRVLHVEMDPDSPLLTRIARSTGRPDILRAAGSRYAPAAPLAEIRAELAQPGRLLFIGKPCDAGAVRQLTLAEPELLERIPYILSFYCAGTPSQTGTDRLVRRMEMEPGEIRHFRYRGDGWPGYATATDAHGRVGRLSYAQSWGEVLAHQVQFRCKICPDSVGGAADVAAADAWYGDESGYPEFEEADGRSLIIARTARGDALVRAAEAAGLLVTTPLAITEIDRMQPHQAERRSLIGSRLVALRLAGRTPPQSGGLRLWQAARRAGLVATLKSTAGTLKRIFRSRRQAAR